jgi:hypothetical protein
MCTHGKDGKTLRGSSAFEGGADTVYFASRDSDVITLEREKRKDGPETDRHELKLGAIEGTGSCVIESHRGPRCCGRPGWALGLCPANTGYGVSNFPVGSKLPVATPKISP